MKPDYAEAFSLYTSVSRRKYLNRAERRRALAAMALLPEDEALFALTLAWTGARISEVLALSASSFQIESGIVALQTLKRRKHNVREVPIPSQLAQRINRTFSIERAQRQSSWASHRIWPWSRTTGWRIIKGVMCTAHVAGCQATPRGLRHGFAIAALQAGVPLNLVQRWMGHSRLSTTAIYAAACGEEEMTFARRFWRQAI